MSKKGLHSYRKWHEHCSRPWDAVRFVQTDHPPILLKLDRPLMNLWIDKALVHP